MIPKKNEYIWSIIGIALIIICTYYVTKNFHNVKIVIQYAGFYGPVLVIILYGLFALTPITTDPLTVVSGVLFGPVFGILISWIGNNVAALIEYYFGHHIGCITNFKKTKKNLPFGLGKLPVSSPTLLIFGRLIPGYGGKLISILAGIYHVPIRTYMWTTAITNLCGSVLLSFGGLQIIHLLK